MSGRFVQDVAALILSTWQNQVGQRELNLDLCSAKAGEIFTRIALSQGYGKLGGRTSLIDRYDFLALDSWCRQIYTRVID